MLMIIELQIRTLAPAVTLFYFTRILQCQNHRSIRESGCCIHDWAEGVRRDHLSEIEILGALPREAQQLGTDGQGELIDGENPAEFGISSAAGNDASPTISTAATHADSCTNITVDRDQPTAPRAGVPPTANRSWPFASSKDPYNSTLPDREPPRG